MKNYNSENINFLWAHNHYISNLPLSDDNINYIKNKAYDKNINVCIKCFNETNIPKFYNNDYMQNVVKNVM